MDSAPKSGRAPRLIFFCGHAGTGKTTVAKRLLGSLIEVTGEPFCFLDKDTLYGHYSASVMSVLTGNANDRDSPTYLGHLRDPEYRGLLDTARENLQLGINAVVVGPLSREVKAHLLNDRQWLQIDAEVDIRIVWMSVDEKIARQRIIKRANPNDAYKLAHWDEYRKRLFKPDSQGWPELLFYDNTASSSEQDATLLKRLLAP